MPVNHGNLPAVHMRCACIDIGTNTTRVLVADVHHDRLDEVLQRRAFTRLGPGLRASGAVAPPKLAEVAAAVAEQRALAARAGVAPEHLRVVATAAIRDAVNRDELVSAVSERAGVDVVVLAGEEEARLAFVGATRTLGRPLPGRVGVVDVGGGSTELAVGTVTGGADWVASAPVGSGLLCEHHHRSDPPAAAELEAMRRHAHAALAPLAPPRPDCAVAVGGSAASLRRLVGDVLNPEAIARAIGTLAGARASEVAARFDVDSQRVRLLPAGILVLDAAAHALGRPLVIGRGGLREGVLLELAARPPV